MLVLLDDIKMNSEKDFFPHLNTTINDKEISDINSLYDYLTETDEKIEFLVTDFDDVTKEGRAFANEVMKVLLDARNQNKNIKVTLM